MADAEPMDAPFGGIRITDTADLNSLLAKMTPGSEAPDSQFDEFWMDMPIDPDMDPLSAEYRRAILAHYRTVAGPASDPPPDADAAGIGADHALVVRPWPYDTGASDQVGAFLRAMGFVIATCRARRGHRVLHFGAGPASLALQLAQMGCSVTALDTSARNIAVMRHRSERMGVPLRLIQATVAGAAAALNNQKFDLVISHRGLGGSIEHLNMLTLIRTQLLAFGGRLVLAGEPLLEALPSPWGLDPTGGGIWAMRRGGGPSLIYRPSYLVHALAACGYRATVTHSLTDPAATIIVATRSPTIATADV